MSQYNEPWYIDEWDGTSLSLYLYDDQDWLVADFNLGYSEKDADSGFSEHKKVKDYYSRIVACVNACRGIPTEALLKAGDESDEKTRLEIMAGELGYVVVDPHY